MITGRPVFFGGARSIAGWFFDTVRDRSSPRCGVLLCPPIGHEYMCGHRAFRRLAIRLADMGFSVLRFDYPGTGDSGDTDSRDSFLPVWKESVHVAADELRRLSGCDTLSIVGLRFGATLAIAAAVARNDVASLVLWSPVTDGRSFVRQTRLLSLASSEHPGELVAEAEGLESAGFFLNAATVSEIASLSLDGITRSAPPNALIYSRDDSPPDRRTARFLTSVNTKCDEWTYAKHATFMVSPLGSVLPAGAIDTIAGWMDQNHPHIEGRDEPVAKVSSTASAQLTLAGGVQESAVSFADGRLKGILVEPAVRTQNPAVILLNTGADHHVGPHRMYVPLAREWAKLGFTVLRFDLGGIGDSETEDTPESVETYPFTAVPDVRAAISFIRTERGYRSVVLAGMCSGGFHAVHAVDRGVAAVIAVNPPLYHHPGDPVEEDSYAYQTEGQRVTRALRNPAKWRRLVAGKVDLGYTLRILSGRMTVALRAFVTGVRRTVTRGGKVGPDPADLFHPAVPVHLIFSGRDASLTFYNDHIARGGRRTVGAPSSTVDVVTDADHTFMAVRWQRTLSEIMTDRLLQYRSPRPATLTTPTTPTTPFRAARESAARI